MRLARMFEGRAGRLCFAVFCLVIGFASGVVVGKARGIPFVSRNEQWTIGIYRGDSPFSFRSPWNLLNPVLKAEHVKDVPAKFVADPFLIKEGGKWYLFFEVYNKKTKQGDLAVATSRNAWIWDYKQVILDEPFHLSYPYVFRWEGNYYLIPESFETNSIRLYKAESFPTKWSFVKTLVHGKDFVDNSIVYFNDMWWLFASTTDNDTLYLYYSESLFHEWKEHPESPIVRGNKHIARPAGRMIVYQGSLYRYAMDVDPPFGTHQVVAFEITEISPIAYSEKPAREGAILKATGSGWNKRGMHHIDPIEIGSGKWIASVDGSGKYRTFGLSY
jgi:hypothetical protein